MRTICLVVVLLVVASFSSADVLGNLKSNNNNLSRMVSISYPGEPDGTNADLNLATQYALVLKQDAKDCSCDWGGLRVYRKGTYKGYFLAGDTVYCLRSARRETDEGVWHTIVRARCGNRSTGCVFEPKPKPCAPTPTPPCVHKPPPPPCPEPIRLPVVIKQPCPPPCQPAQVVVNTTVNTTIVHKEARTAPRLTPVGATRTIVQKKGGVIGGGVTWCVKHHKFDTCDPGGKPPPDPPGRPASPRTD